MTKSLKRVACYPSCGFMAQSENEKELINFIKVHILKSHNILITDLVAKNRIIYLNRRLHNRILMDIQRSINQKTIM